MTHFLSVVARCAITLLASTAGFVARADEPQRPASEVAAGPLSAGLLKTGLYLLSGGGSNTLMRLSASGSVLVDGKLAGHYRPLMSQVRRISKLSDLPVRALFITDHHAHHIGDHAQFLASGVAVIVQQNARPRLPDSAAPGAVNLAPVVTFDREYTLHIGGVEVRSLHVGRAHTDDDAVVYFPDLKVVAIGDLFTPDAPAPDFAGGGSLVGWGPALDQLLKLDFDIAVPSLGVPISRAELLAFKTRIDTLTARAMSLVQGGVAKDRLLAQLVTDDLGWRLSFSAESLDGLYADLLLAH